MRYEFTVLASHDDSVAVLADRCVIEAGNLTDAVRAYGKLFVPNPPSGLGRYPAGTLREPDAEGSR